MRLYHCAGCVTASWAVLLSPLWAAGSAQLPDLSQYEQVLTKYVSDDGRVDYAGINSANALQEFVRQLAAVSPDSQPALFPTREARLSYWINAYNALVLHAFAREYPEKRNRLKSILGRGVFFYRMKHVVGGARRTLADIEDNSIRTFRDPRIHFAIVCASASCPVLSQKPFVADRLNDQLDVQTRRYFAAAHNFAVNVGRRQVTLPRIFDWFKEDFGGTPEKVLAFVVRYREGEEARSLSTGQWKIAYFPYDWSPNDTRR